MSSAFYKRRETSWALSDICFLLYYEQAPQIRRSQERTIRFQANRTTLALQCRRCRNKETKKQRKKQNCTILSTSQWRASAKVTLRSLHICRQSKGGSQAPTKPANSGLPNFRITRYGYNTHRAARYDFSNTFRCICE